METFLAILMALGIFVGIPIIIGLSVVGVYLMSNRRVLRTQRAKALEASAEAVKEQPAREPAKVI
jgi:hypothetical protein